MNNVATEAGQITRPKMLETLAEHNTMLKESFKEEIETSISKCISGREGFSRIEAEFPAENLDEIQISNVTRNDFTSYNHSGKLGLYSFINWDFPYSNLKQA